MKKSKTKYVIKYRSDGQWWKYGERDSKKEAEAVGSGLVRSYIADYYKVEKV